VQTSHRGPQMTKLSHFFPISLIRPHSRQDANMLTCKLQWQTGDSRSYLQNKKKTGYLHCCVHV